VERRRQGAPITSFAIVTTAAALSTERYHDRLPLLLEESQFEDWMRGPPSLTLRPSWLRANEEG
jgi:putative SOS response-associated peptidase YedK